MAKIKKLSIFDIVEVKKMISLLSESETLGFSKYILTLPFKMIQDFLPLKLRKFSEYFVSIENHSINGMISVKAERGNSYKWNIKQLFLDKNSYLAGRQLVDYIVSKFGALGANTFCVVVDDGHDELIDLFSKGCGFRLCSHESIWKMNETVFSEPTSSENIYRPFKNSDARKVCELYNEGIYPHFRYSLTRAKAEFYDRIFQGLSSTTYFKYVVEDVNTHKTKAYIEIQTNDNSSYILDIILSNAYEDCYSDIVGFAVNQILRRRKNFDLFILNRKYMTNAKKTEDFLKEKNFSMIQNQMVLVRDFFKTIRQEEKIAKPAIAFTEIKGRPAFNFSREDSL